MKKRAIAAIGLAIFLSASAGTARAQGDVWGRWTIDHSTYFTISQPFTVGGVTLPAGTYLFRLPDPTFDPSVMQVLSQDQHNVYAMVDTIPIIRSKGTDGPELVFDESRLGSPRSLRAWYMPDELTGREIAPGTK